MSSDFRERVLYANDILTVLEGYGLQFSRQGKERFCLCPFHDDSSPSLRVNIEKRLWRCDPCDIGGSVIDFVAMKEGITPVEAIKRLAERGRVESDRPVRQTPSTRSVTDVAVAPKIVNRYDYLDANKKMRYQVCRLEPKSFRQRRAVDGKWVWNMDGVERVLYHLPEILTSDEVCITEGEKDADTICSFGYTGTTNVGGAKKWLDGYSDSLKGKSVFIFPDNDEAGRAHAAQVAKSLHGKAKQLRMVSIPDQFKDVTDWLSSFKDKPQAAQELSTAITQAKPFSPHGDLPIMSMEEMELAYRNEVQQSESNSLSLSKWLPSFHNLRPLRAGETMVVMADTGRGKSLVLQHIALYAHPLPVLFFEVELPEALMYERFVQIADKRRHGEIEAAYKNGNPTWNRGMPMDHIYLCPKSSIGIEEIETTINRAELKMGKRPAVVMVDYIGLVSCKAGSRYERISHIAEQLKVLAKSTHTIIVMASQVHRKEGSDSTFIPELHSAKDSGSIENSAGLVIGAWREGDGGEIMKLRVLKNTKGQCGQTVDCDFIWDTLSIRESSRLADYSDSAAPDKKQKSLFGDDDE